jgi:hypothetical protein
VSYDVMARQGARAIRPCRPAGSVTDGSARDGPGDRSCDGPRGRIRGRLRHWLANPAGVRDVGITSISLDPFNG